MVNFLKKYFAHYNKTEPIFIECRFGGWPRDYFKDLNRELSKYGSEKIKVPHVTLYGPSTTTNLNEIKNIIEDVSKQYDLVPFKTKQFSYFDFPHKKWNIIRINPSPELEALRLQMAQSLIKSKIAPPKSYDGANNYNFHISIGKTENPRTFNRLCRIVNKWENLDIPLYLLRISIIGDVHGDSQKIKCEYDLLQKKWLTRKEALSKHCYRDTIEELRKKLALAEIPEKRQSMWGNLLGFFRKMMGRKNIYLISDTHFNDAEIIKVCHRPFSSVVGMNTNIVKNWNQRVTKNDLVYFLGDWTYSSRASYWVKRLNGNIISIKGNHDRFQRGIHFNHSKVLTIGKYSFLLIHDPDKRHHNWKGWTIHGHHHNNYLHDYPFINGERKTINVSAELVNYAPVSIDYLLSLDLDSIKRMRTINDQPERK